MNSFAASEHSVSKVVKKYKNAFFFAHNLKDILSISEFIIMHI